ncbi:MAG: ERF family protein [Kiritimatiellia bacterium]
MDETFKGAGIQAKLSYIQVNLRVPKDMDVKNWQGKTQYQYRNLSSIFEKVKPLLEQTGCNLKIVDETPVVVGGDITPVFETVKNKNGNTSQRMLVGPRIYIRAHAILTDIETGESVEAVRNARETEWRTGMDPAQLTGATSSYAGKYAAEALFGLDGSDDADALAAKENAPRTGGVRRTYFGQYKDAIAASQDEAPNF